MTRNELMLASALSYCNEFGLAVLPVEPGKKYPRLKSWKPWQNKKPEEIQIKRWWGDIWPGSDICLVCGEVSNRIVIDIDTYKDKATLEKIDSLTPEQAVFPIADTPRGGEHRHFAWQAGIPNAALEYIDVKSDGGLAMLPPSGVNGKHYKWRTGCSIRQIKASFLFNSYVDYIKSSTNKVYNGDNWQQLATTGNKIKDGSRDNTLFHIANCLVKGQMPVQEIQQVLTLIGLYGCETSFSQKEIQTKVLSALNRSDGISRAWQEEVEKLLLKTSGTVTTTNVHQWLQAITRKEKQCINMALQRLAEKGILKKSELRAGQYRIINKNVVIKDWKKAKTEKLDFTLPLGMHEAVRIRPGSIILFSGSNNSGKTAMAMEIVALNCRKFDTYYFSSEIEEDEFNERAASYSSLDDWDCVFGDGWDPLNVGDIIVPNGLNIIDYLEPPGGDYAQMAIKLTEIHKSLDKGVAVVCLQKKGDSEFGAGGEFMMNKPQFICNLDKSNYPVCKLTIRKCKAPQHGYINPGGLSVEYSIARNGVHIQPYGKFDFQKWEREYYEPSDR